VSSYYEEKLVEFQHFVIKLRNEKKYLLGQIGNADQSSVYFIMPANFTIAKMGHKDVKNFNGRA
jgi:hypothetical protein